MDTINKIAGKTSHHPFPFPGRDRKFYQEWHDVVFAHWKVPLAALKNLLPAGFEPDLYNGDAWVSLLAFSLKNLRPYLLPSCPSYSNFNEIIVRTYVRRNDEPGILFLSLEAEKYISALLSKFLSGHAYYKSEIIHHPDYHESKNMERLFYLKSRYRPGNQVAPKNELDKWLTDRNCIYNEFSGKVYRNDIHHEDWILKPIEISFFEINYRFKGLLINDWADLYHYSDGVHVTTMGKVKA